MKFLIPFSFLLLTVVSCSLKNDTESVQENDIDTFDLTVSMVENPENGDAVGTVIGISNGGALTFSIESQNPEGSMEIDPSTGNLTVLDKREFEYQINPMLTATVSVTDGTITETAAVTVNLEERTNVFIGDVILNTQEEVDTFGAERYTEVSGYVFIGYQQGIDITNLEPLLGLNYIGNYLVVSFNEQLNNLDGLESLIHVKTFLQINNNPVLTNINGLKNLEKVGDSQFLSSGSVTILQNPLLQNLDGLSDLREVSAYIHIRENQSLLNIDGLSEIENIESLVIFDNDQITNIDGLRSTSFIVKEITIKFNDGLVNFCGLEPTLSTNNFQGTYDVAFNAYNPTQQQIENGECSQ